MSVLKKSSKDDNKLFSGFLTFKEGYKDRIDVAAPSIHANTEEEILRLLIPLREPRHTGVIILNSALWEFSEVYNLDEYFEEETT